MMQRIRRNDGVLKLWMKCVEKECVQAKNWKRERRTLGVPGLVAMGVGLWLAAWPVGATDSVGTKAGEAVDEEAVRADGTDPSGQDLQAQIDALRSRYEERIRALEDRVVELEHLLSAGGESGEDTTVEDELAALREAAAAASAEATLAVDSPPPTEGVTSGRERNLSALNPEISFTGDVLALVESGHQSFVAREFELDLQASLDPFSSTKWTLAFSEEEGVEIEEGYIRYAGLAPGLELRAGKMRQSFGALNRTHLHALPQVDYPLVLSTYFGEEGLAQTGLSASWLLPKGWASANEMTLQVTDGSAEPFGGEDFEDLALLGHLKNYWDLSPSTYFEWGLSGIVGSPTEDRDTRVWGTDVTVHWQPPGRGKYRELTWRSELLLSQRDDESGLTQEAMGGYTYLEGLVRRNLYAGVRYDWLEDPFAPDDETWAVEPYVSWWQSEYVRLRAAYQYLNDESRDGAENRFTLQLTWAAGPHKHDAY